MTLDDTLRKLAEPEPRKMPGQSDAFPELEMVRERRDGTGSLFVESQPTRPSTGR